jgi:hypothetical protein
MSSHQLSRRAVARGAAWSVPLVAVGVAAPAFAASVPGPSGADPGKSCKCPGGGSPWTYNLNVHFTAPGTDSFSFVVDSFLVDGAAPTSYVEPIGTTALPGGEGTVLFRFRSTNSSSTHTVQITYTPTNTTTNTVLPPVTLTMNNVMFNPCKDDEGYNYSCA